jgi:hypothetical protein
VVTAGTATAASPVVARPARAPPGLEAGPRIALEPIVVSGRAAAASGAAHSMQNFALGPFAVPQFAHCVPSSVAHSMQNFAPARFSVPQFEQITLGG